MALGKVTILGINGHLGHHLGHAFVAGGWEVVGFGRTDRHHIAGVRFVAGDADNVEDLRRAIGDSDIVVNTLNLPYHLWDKGRMEALHARVVEAMGTSGKTMLFPGNIYNFAADAKVLTPSLVQKPATPRGAIRVRSEEILAAAAKRGDIRAVIIRAGDFFGPDCREDWFDQVILREAGKGRVATLGSRGVGHAWAYLPDLARAFEVVARERARLGAFEAFHFKGHFVTPEHVTAAVQKAAPVALKASHFPWLILHLLGVANPVMREVAKMGYLWERPLMLRDNRFDELLGANFDTPFDEAIAATLTRFFPARAAMAA
jgi:nucleoside-diphosphate-sugar epimerase